MHSEIAERVRVAMCGESGETLEAELRFDGDMRLFEGHFPGEPIVPGVAQFEVVRSVAETRLGRSLALARVVRGKFTGKIAPGETVRVTGTLREEGSDVVVQAVLRCASRDVGRVKLVLREREPLADGAGAETLGGRDGV